MDYLKSDFKRHLKEFEIDGFSRIGNEYLFRKNFKEGFLEIAISTSNYFPNKFTFDAVIPGIRFEQVEKILEEVCPRYIKDYPIGAKTISQVFYLSNSEYAITNKSVSNDEEFYGARSELYKLIESSVLPFFEKYNTIEKLSTVIDLNNLHELENFLLGLVPFKILIIKKLAGDTKDFEKYLADQKIFYTTEVFKYPQYFKDHDLVFKDLLKLLDSL